MKQKSNTYSANGSTSHQQCSKNTGRTGYSMAISPTLLPTPTARDTRVVSPNQKPRDDLTCAVELGATKTKRSLFSQEASLASHLAMQGEEKAQQMTATSGQTCFELYKTSSQTGSSLKMCVGLLLGTTAWYSSRCALTWRAKVTKSNRLLFQLVPSTPRTDETGSGLLLTPRTRETEQDLEKFKARMAKYRNGTTMPNLATQIGAETGEKLRLQPAMPEWMMGFPERWTEFPTASPNGEMNQSKPTATQ